MDQKSNLSGAIEAALFIYGEPISLGKLSELVKTDEAAVSGALSELKTRLSAGGGLTLIENGDKIQLVTKPEHSTIIENVVKLESHEELTPAAQETLAIVAYSGPMSRSDIEYVRGVNSSFILRSLALRGLVDRSQDPHRSNAYLYSLSFDCLKFLGLSSPAELPDYEKYRKLAAEIKK